MSPPSNLPTPLPFSDFCHCPRCGAKPLSRLGPRAIACESCRFKFYFNCASGVCAFLFHQGKLILCVRGQEPQKGLLDLPGGFVEFDETAEEALAREIAEELNLKVADFSYLASEPNDYRYAGVMYKTTDLYFLAEAGDISAIKARDDVADYLLIAPQDLDPDSLAFPSCRRAFKRLLEHLQCGLEPSSITCAPPTP